MTLLSAMLLCFAACGKKDDAPPTPLLSAPQAMEKIAAAAEVKASSGPIELSLLVRETQIKAGDSIWEQIRIRNVGNEEIFVSDPIFFNPRELVTQSYSRYGIYLEAIGPDGKALKTERQTPANQGNDLILDGVPASLRLKARKNRPCSTAGKSRVLACVRSIRSCLI